MKFAIYALSIMMVGCTKTDMQWYKHSVKKHKNSCYTLSVNADRQNTSDFYMIKTVDDDGMIRHVKTQLLDLQGVTYIFDYDISYAYGKAILKGTTKRFYWVLDNPPPQDDNGPYIPPEPGAPRHPVEDLANRDSRDFEIFFDKKTGYASAVKYIDSLHPALQLSYDKSGRLTGVGNYSVTTDHKGNILSMLTPKPTEPYLFGQQLGVTFTYSGLHTVKATNQYYETPFIFIHPMYSLLEVLNWGPFQPHAQRTGYSLQWYHYDPELVGEYGAPSPWVYAQYSNHQYDEEGNLVSYTFYGDLTTDPPGPDVNETDQRPRIIEWNCNVPLIKDR